MRSFHEIRLLWRQQAWRMSMSLVLDICTWVSSHSALCTFQLRQISLCFPCATWEGKGVILLLLCQVGDQGSLQVCPGPHPLQLFSLKGVSSFKGHCLGGRASASHDHPPVLPLSLLPFFPTWKHLSSSPSEHPSLLKPATVIHMSLLCSPRDFTFGTQNSKTGYYYYFFILLHSVL